VQSLIYFNRRLALNQLVRSAAEFRSAEAAGKLVKIATADGMALIFYNRREVGRVRVADKRALEEHPRIAAPLFKENIEAFD